MKLSYFPETDSLYIELSSKLSTDSKELSPGVVVDYDAEGGIVGFDIDHASKNFDLSKVETSFLPLAKSSV